MSNVFNAFSAKTEGVPFIRREVKVKPRDVYISLPFSDMVTNLQTASKAVQQCGRVFSFDKLSINFRKLSGFRLQDDSEYSYLDDFAALVGCLKLDTLEIRGDLEHLPRKDDSQVFAFLASLAKHVANLDLRPLKGKLAARMTQVQWQAIVDGLQSPTPGLYCCLSQLANGLDTCLRDKVGWRLFIEGSGDAASAEHRESLYGFIASCKSRELCFSSVMATTRDDDYEDFMDDDDHIDEEAATDEWQNLYTALGSNSAIQSVSISDSFPMDGRVEKTLVAQLEDSSIAELHIHQLNRAEGFEGFLSNVVDALPSTSLRSVTAVHNVYGIPDDMSEIGELENMLPDLIGNTSLERLSLQKMDFWEDESMSEIDIPQEIAEVLERNSLLRKVRMDFSANAMQVFLADLAEKSATTFLSPMYELLRKHYAPMDLPPNKSAATRPKGKRKRGRRS